MPKFELVSLADAEINSATGKRAQIIREYIGYIDRLSEGQAGKLVAAEGETTGAVRRRLGAAAKLRSVHNNYMTLPVVFIMISGHYPATYGHPQSWLILAAISVIGMAVHHTFNLRTKGCPHHPF